MDILLDSSLAAKPLSRNFTGNFFRTSANSGWFFVLSVQQPDRPKYRSSIESFFRQLNSLDIKDDNGLADKIRFQLTNVVSR